MQILNQDILNLIVLGLREQGTPGIDHGDYDQCEYLTEGGLRCAVGMLFPGKTGGVFAGLVFKQDRAFWDLLNKFGVQKSAHAEFLDWLQDWHDDRWLKLTRNTPQAHRHFKSAPIQRTLEEHLRNWNEDNADPDDRVSLRIATRFALDFEKGLRNAHQG